MVIASHVIFGAYGFWLPNDPRGSWSDFVGRWELVRFGQATTVTVRQSLATVEHDRKLRESAKKALLFDPVVFNGRQALAVSHGFKKAIDESGYVLYACAILPEHVHLVIARHLRKAEKIVGHMKTRATQILAEEGEWPSQIPVWALGCWKVFLNTPADILRAIQYVEQNPIKEGKPAQKWSFVTPFRG